MKHTKLVLMLTLILTGLSARADITAKTDFYFPMKLADYSTLLMNQPIAGQDQTVMPNYQIDKPYKTSIVNTSLSLAYTAQVKPQDQHGNFSFNLNLTQSSFQAQQVITDDVIQKTMGGITVNISLKGSCSNVSFNSKSPASVSGTFDVVAEGATLVAHIDTMTINGLGQWDVSVGSCNGPVGYQDALVSALKDFVGNQQAMSDMFRNQLQAKLNGIISGMTSKVMAERHVKITDKINLVLSPTGIYLNKDSGQVILYGAATTVIASPSNATYDVPAQFSADDEKAFPQSGFILPQDYVTTLSKALYQSGTYSYGFNSNAFPDLKSLFGNRIYQFFLWRDLVMFKLDSIFNFAVHANQEPKVAPLGSNAGYAWFSLSGPVATDIQAPKNNQYVPYMTVNSNASVNAWLGVLQGKALIGFQSPTLDATKKWDANYQAQYHPSDSINLSFFTKKVTDMISKKRFLFDLPTVEVGDSQMLAPQSFTSNKKWVQIVYQPTTGN